MGTQPSKGSVGGPVKCEGCNVSLDNGFIFCCLTCSSYHLCKDCAREKRQTAKHLHQHPLRLKVITGKPYQAAGEQFELKDKLGRWYRIQVISNSETTVTVNYVGWSNKYNEDINIDDFTERAGPVDCNVHLPNITANGVLIEVFNSTLQRWRLAKVVEVSDSAVKVDWKDSEWIPRSHEFLSTAGTHIKNPKDVTEDTNIPNGKENALRIAAEIRTNDIPASLDVFEDLALQHALTEGICLDMGQVLEAIGLAYIMENMTAYDGCTQQRRYYESRALLATERAFLSNIPTSSQTSVCMLFASSDVAGETEEERGDSNTLKTAVAITPHHVDYVLRTWRRFRDLLHEEWSDLSETIRGLLDSADFLELDACRATTTATRRVNFSEAAYQMEKVLLLSRNRSVHSAIYWRISRHYILGLGIDTTEYATRLSADIQASEFLYPRIYTHHPHLDFYRGVLHSLNRWKDPNKPAEHYLTLAASTGVPYAAFWLATMYLEGWGPLQGNRLNELEKAKSLFESCKDFNCMPDICECRIKLIESLKNREDSSCHRHYLLSLYIFAERVKSLLEDSLTELLLRALRYIAPRLNTPGPSDATGPESSWLKELRKRVWPTIRVLDFSSSSDAVEKAKTNSTANSRGSQIMTEFWIRQNFNLLFPLPVSNDGTVRCPNSHELTKHNHQEETTGEYICDICGAENLERQPSYYSCRDCNYDMCEVCHSNEHSKPPLRKWDMDQVRAYYKLIGELSATFLPFLASYNGIKSPLDDLQSRVEEMEYSGEGEEVVCKFYSDKFSRQAMTIIWNECMSLAHLIFETIDQRERFLMEQIAYYENIVQYNSSQHAIEKALNVYISPSNEGSEEVKMQAVLKVIKLARQLAVLSGEADPEIVGKHTSSAIAVMDYARNKSLEVPKAIDELESLGFAILRTTPCSASIPSVGFHLVIEALRVQSFLQKLQGTSHHDQNLQQRIDFLNAHPTHNREWRGTGYEIGDTTKSLLEIFNRFRELVDRVEADQQHVRESQPLKAHAWLDLHAVTYKDPWISLCSYDLDSVFADLPQNPIELAQEFGMTEVEATNQMLSLLIEEHFQKFRENVSSIFDRLSGYRDVSSQVVLKKKMLYLLRHAPGVDWDLPESVHILEQQIIGGTLGRCPDGISSFCDDFLTNLQLEQLKDNVFSDVSPEVAKLIVSVSIFMYNWKDLFQKKHLPRLKCLYEGRTALSVVLRNLLMLPLSLVGEYTPCLYPRFAAEGHSSSTRDALDSDAICSRFLMGGTLKFDHPAISVEFEPLSLPLLLTEFRYSIVQAEHGRSEDNQAQYDPELEPPPRFTYTISEDIITKFFEMDIAIGPFYSSALASGWSCENIYFHALSPDSDEPTGESIPHTLPVIARVMKDRALVRIFQVCKYAVTSPNFEMLAPSNWSFSN